MTGSSNDETNFPHELLLTDTQVSKIRKAFANGSSADIKFSKTQLSKTIQSGGIPPELIGAIPLAMFQSGKRSIKKSISLAPALAGRAAEYYINKGVNKLNKKFTSSKFSGITLTNNEIKDIAKVIKSSENRLILLKKATRKITSQEGGFINFLRPLMNAGLPLMKSVLTPLAKSVLLP